MRGLRGQKATMSHRLKSSAVHFPSQHIYTLSEPGGMTAFCVDTTHISDTLCLMLSLSAFIGFEIFKYVI